MEAGDIDRFTIMNCSALREISNSSKAGEGEDSFRTSLITPQVASDENSRARR